MIPVPSLDEQRRIVAYFDSVQARLALLREVQSATGEELRHRRTLLPSALRSQGGRLRESCDMALRYNLVWRLT